MFVVLFEVDVKKLFSKILIVAVFLLASNVKASEKYVELSRGLPNAQADKIVVLEFFSYGCAHCYSLESSINPWAEKLPSDIIFEKVPVMFGGDWDVYGQLFITLKIMNVDARVHDHVFEAVHQRRPLLTPDNMADFLESEGVDKEMFLSTYNSFAVLGKVVSAKNLTKNSGVTGVPALLVGGKYRFDLSAGGKQGLLDLAETLIARERNQG